MRRKGRLGDRRALGKRVTARAVQRFSNTQVGSEPLEETSLLYLILQPLNDGGFVPSARDHGAEQFPWEVEGSKVIDSIFVWPSARARHREAPLLEEREQFLSHLLQHWSSHERVRSIATSLLHVIRLMKITNLRSVDPAEIEIAGERWVKGPGCMWAFYAVAVLAFAVVFEMGVWDRVLFEFR
jgi:hypothetical protein